MKSWLVAVVLAIAGRAAAADSLADAQLLLCNGRYADATALTETLPADERQLAIYELRTSARVLQIRRAIGDPRDKEQAFKACGACGDEMHAFMRDLREGQTLARATLKEKPKDPNALFFLGKLDLNYLWLVLGTLGRRTGWNEVTWEARRSLDALLADQPHHLRGRVARAWIDYIVDTRMPWGTAWMLGGGNKKRALTTMKEAADVEGDFYANAEALFGLWDMQVRERNVRDALRTARRLAARFPENREVASFVARHSSTEH